MGEPVLTPLPVVAGQGDLTWYMHRDGYTVYECMPLGHMWRRASPMSTQCIFCLAYAQQVVSPRTDMCPARFEEPPCD